MHSIDGFYFVTFTHPASLLHVRQRHGKFLRKDLLPISATFDISGNYRTDLLSHPIVTHLMLVTTNYHPRSLPHPNETDEIEGPWPQDGLSGAIGEDRDRGDLMGGSHEGLYSSDEGEQHFSAW